ncbi:MAG: NADH-quinone oxidoreductase subunit NuoE [Deltaproteobacteria bacterium]|nr:NADH-quinone oxidoreductase subunit NuoE [Deltaproteobacteria bacterium]
MSFEFTKENLEKFEETLKRYPQKRAALLPALWLVQEQQGWISPESMETLAKLLGLTPAYIYETATFYTMYNMKPIGRHHIQVCNSVCCCLRGSEETVGYLKKKLEIEVGESTQDGRFHLSTVECLGSCGTAPMMQIDNDYHEDLTEEKIDQILEKLK